MTLIGILGVSACMKLSQYESLPLEAGIDRFVNELLAYQGESIKKFFDDTD